MESTNAKIVRMQTSFLVHAIIGTLMIAVSTSAVELPEMEEMPQLKTSDAIGSVGQQLSSKRAWQNLQGSWGKRTEDDAPASIDYDMMASGAPNDYDGDIDYQDLVRYVMFYTHPDLVIPSGNGGASMNEHKRGWKNMNVAWGKRRSADWNKFRGAWGKREPGWNNLKGLWGKRAAAGDWNKLQSAWGKRSISRK